MSDPTPIHGHVQIEDGVNPTPDVFGTSRKVVVSLTFDCVEDALEAALDRVSKLAATKIDVLLGRTPGPTAEAPKVRQPRKAAETPAEAPKVAETPKVEDPDAWEEETPPDEAPAVVEITDADLNSACAKTNQRLGGQDKGGPAKIKALVAVYSPAGVQPKAGVIPADKRQEFLDALAELA